MVRQKHGRYKFFPGSKKHRARMDDLVNNLFIPDDISVAEVAEHVENLPSTQEKRMRAILIDPERNVIEEVDYDGNYKSIHKLINCDVFTVINLGNGESLFLDDEGLLKDPEFFFTLDGPDFKYPQPLAGKGLVLGVDDAGESIATKLSIAKLAVNISFEHLQVAGWTPTKTEENVDLPYGGGKGFRIIGPKPIFKRKE